MRNTSWTICLGNQSGLNLGVKIKSGRFLEHQFLIVNISLKCRFLFHPCLSFIFKCENKNKCLFLSTTSFLEALQGMIIFTLAWVPYLESTIPCSASRNEIVLQYKCSFSFSVKPSDFIKILAFQVKTYQFWNSLDFIFLAKMKFSG